MDFSTLCTGPTHCWRTVDVDISSTLYSAVFVPIITQLIRKIISRPTALTRWAKWTQPRTELQKTGNRKKILEVIWEQAASQGQRIVEGRNRAHVAVGLSTAEVKRYRNTICGCSGRWSRTQMVHRSICVEGFAVVLFYGHTMRGLHRFRDIEANKHHAAKIFNVCYASMHARLAAC